MKHHILAALHEERDQWEELLAGMSAAQICAAPPGELSVKDVIAHLMAWQQRSIARLEAGLHDRPPVFPAWPAGLEPDSEAGTSQVNAWIYETYRDQPWPDVYDAWRAGFRRFLELGEAVPERELLDSGRYAWLDGRPLALVLVASYDHHHEHLEALRGG